MKIYEPDEYDIEFCSDEQRALDDCLSLLEDIIDEMRERDCDFIEWTKVGEIRIDCIEQLRDWLDTISHADKIY